MDLAVPARRVPAAAKSVPHVFWEFRAAQVRQNGAGIVDLVGRAHPPRSLSSHGKTMEVVFLPLIVRKLAAIRSDASLGHGEHGLEHGITELVADPAPQRLGGVTAPDAVLD